MHHVEIVSRLEDEHVDHLEDLIKAVMKIDDHEPIGEHKFLRLKQGDDVGVAMLAYESGELVGYAHTLSYGHGGERRVSCELVIHPDHRRQGIGGALLQRVIDHARAQAAPRLDLWAYNDSKASRHLATGYAFEPQRRLLHMHRHPGEPPRPAAPNGARVRAFRATEEDETLVQLNNRIFEQHPEQGHWTIEDLRTRMDQPWFDAQDVLMLEVDGELAGFCWLKVEERGSEGRIGEIYVIGTSPDFRGRGLGHFLLSEALQHLSRREIEAVAVYVDELNEDGVRLYESFDFHHHHVDVCYTRLLRPGDGTSSADRANASLDAAATGSP